MVRNKMSINVKYKYITLLDSRNDFKNSSIDRFPERNHKTIITHYF